MPRARTSGFGLVELLTVLLVAAVVVTLSLPLVAGFYRRHQLAAAASAVQNTVREARWKALKEKAVHRILFHDENSSMPNVIELQRSEHGTFVTLPRHVVPVPEHVRILGSGATDSADRLAIGTRGECDSVKVFLGGQDGTVTVVSIAPTCSTSVL